MPEPACERVFVYGTLRRGQAFRPSIEHLVTESVDATIRGRMYHFASDGSRGEWPFLVEGDDLIVGEVLSFSSFREALAILDDVEDYPELYTRHIVGARKTTGELVDAWTYFIQPGQERWGQLVESGDWVADQRGESAPDSDHSKGDAL